MKQMTRRINILYRWWRTDDKAIKPGHLEALEESAQDRIKEQMSAGNTSGELCDTIRMTDRDGEDGIEYRGYWEMRVTNEEEEV
jgi:hypothetical protein